MANGQWHQWETLFSAGLPHCGGLQQWEQWGAAVGAVGSRSDGQWGARVGTVGSRSDGQWERWAVGAIGSGEPEWEQWGVGAVVGRGKRGLGTVASGNGG